MEFVTAYDAFTKDPVKEDSERIYVHPERKGKDRERKIENGRLCNPSHGG